jgi:hypothetical protein
LSTIKNDEMKYYIILLDGLGSNGREIFEETGVPTSTSHDFLSKNSWKLWWEEKYCEDKASEQLKVATAVDGDYVATNADWLADALSVDGWDIPIGSGEFKMEDGSSQAGLAPSKVKEISDKEKLEDACDSEDWHVANLAKRLRTTQRTNSQLRKVINSDVDRTSHFPSMVSAVEKATSDLNSTVYAQRPYVLEETGTQPAIMEILFSDWQIGKVGQYYNSNLGERALAYYGQQLIKLIDDRKAKYKLDKIVFGSLGDIVEDHLKHGVQSATSTDCGLSEQMAKAIVGIWEQVLQPLGELGIPIELICIAGNHGSSEHKGMDMYKAGLYSYDYAIYKALEGYCKVAGYKHVKFIQPEGCFGYTDIYGRYAVYEHGYFNSCTEKSLLDQLGKRSSQIKRHVEYFRCGDMHHVCAYDNAKLVVNGAFFGADDEGVEYSGILGFNAIPAQVVMFHTDEKSIGKNTVSEFITIQVAEGY